MSYSRRTVHGERESIPSGNVRDNSIRKRERDEVKRSAYPFSASGVSGTSPHTLSHTSCFTGGGLYFEPAFVSNLSLEFAFKAAGPVYTGDLMPGSTDIPVRYPLSLPYYAV